MTLVNAKMVRKKKRAKNRDREGALFVSIWTLLPEISPSMALAYTRRLNKELAEIHTGTPVGINLVNADTLEKWLFTIEVMGTSEYEAS